MLRLVGWVCVRIWALLLTSQLSRTVHSREEEEVRMTAQDEQRRQPAYVTLIAIYHFVDAGLGFLAALGLAALGVAIAFTVYDEAGLIWGLFAIGVGVIIVGAACIIHLLVGFGLLKTQGWARWAAIVLAVLGLGAFPVGTAIGALILVYLLGDEGRKAFEGE